MKLLFVCAAFSVAALSFANQSVFAIEEIGLPTPAGIPAGSVTEEVVVIGEEYITPSVEVVPCKSSCVSYRYHRLGSRCKFERCDMHEACVLVKDPCSSCYIEVPVCVPRCCTAVCSVECRKGLFGRTKYEYCWDCGFRMEVVVKKDGDMIVHYYGVR